MNFDLIEKLENEYLFILEGLSSRIIDKTNIVPVLDEIHLFWERKKEEILLIIESLSLEEEDVVFYTGATGLERKDKEHLPLLSANQICFYDDPLSVHLEMIASEITNMSTFFLKKVSKTISENIDIIKNYPRRIVLCPLRLLLINKVELNDTIEKIFISLFKGQIKNINECIKYLKLQKNIKDWINTNLSNSFIFLEQNTSSDKFGEIVDFSHHCAFPTEFANNIYAVIFYSYYSIITQAVSILIVATKTGFYPYIRSFVPVINITILFDGLFKGNKQLLENNYYMTLRTKTICFHLFYKKIIGSFINGSISENFVLNRTFRTLNDFLNKKKISELSPRKLGDIVQDYIKTVFKIDV